MAVYGVLVCFCLKKCVVYVFFLEEKGPLKEGDFNKGGFVAFVRQVKKKVL